MNTATLRGWDRVKFFGETDVEALVAVIMGGDCTKALKEHHKVMIAHMLADEEFLSRVEGGNKEKIKQILSLETLEDKLDLLHEHVQSLSLSDCA